MPKERGRPSPKLLLVGVLGLGLTVYFLYLDHRHTAFREHAAPVDGVVVETRYDLRTPYARVELSGGRTVDVSQFRQQSPRPPVGAHLRVLVTPADSYGIEVGSSRGLPVGGIVTAVGFIAVLVLSRLVRPSPRGGRARRT